MPSAFSFPSARHGRSLRSARAAPSAPPEPLPPPARPLPIPPPRQGPRLVVVPWHLSAAPPDEEVQVSALIRLQDMLVIQPGVAPGPRRLGRRPSGRAAGKLVAAHVERQRPA